MKVIVPCGGRSSRYPGTPPKWMLPSSGGRPMIEKAVSAIGVDVADLIITILKEHDEKYDACAGIRSVFGKGVNVVVLDDPTSGQPETVVQTLLKTGLNEPFLVKDSDNSFALPDVKKPYNYVCCESLNNFDSINPRNKSYIRTDESDVIVAIREKQVISDLFSVGGYYFINPHKYISTYEALTQEHKAWQSELYTSDIIAMMILEGEPFMSRCVTEYEDWGTLKEWSANLQSQGAYFVSVDGFILTRGNAHFKPRFSDAVVNQEAVEATRQLVQEGHRLIFLSIRPEAARAETSEILQSLGLPTTDIIFDMPLGRYSVVSTPHATVPFVTAHGMELTPDEPSLVKRLRFER